MVWKSGIFPSIDNFLGLYYTVTIAGRNTAPAGAFYKERSLHMKCCSCGGEIRDDARFCPLCGADQTAAPVVEEPAFIPAEPVPAEEPAFIPAEPAFIPAEPAPQPKYEYVPQPESKTRPVNQIKTETVYQTVYQSNASAANRPCYQLPDRRGLLKMIFLGLITFGIYNVVIASRIAEEINIVASKYDGKRTQQFFWMLVLGALTFGIYPLVWIHGLSNRIGTEVERRGINYKFGAVDFWIWNLLVGVLCAVATVVAAFVASKSNEGKLIVGLIYVAGSILTAVGPYVYTFKLCKATNLMNRDYNING